MRPKDAVRLFEVEVSQIVENHDQEARVHEVQNRVLVASDVAIDGQPPLRQCLVEGPVVEIRGRIAEEVPAGVQEGVRDVRLTTRVGAALWTRGPVPLLDAGKWAHAGIVGLEVLHAGQEHRQVLLRDGDRAARVAVDDRDRWPPITLTRYAPVV